MGEALITRRGGGSGTPCLTGTFKYSQSTSNKGIFSINVDFEPKSVAIWCTSASTSSYTGIHTFLWEVSGNFFDVLSYDTMYHIKSHPSTIIEHSYSNGQFTITVPSTMAGTYGFRTGQTYSYMICG